MVIYNRPKPASALRTGTPRIHTPLGATALSLLGLAATGPAFGIGAAALTSLAVLAAPSVVYGQPAPPQSLQARLSRVEWTTNKHNSLAVDLKPASQINHDVRFFSTLHFNTNNGRYASMVPIGSNHHLVDCKPMEARWLPQNQNTVGMAFCRMTAAKAKALTAPVSMKVTFYHFSGNKELNLTIRPYDGPNYVQQPWVVTAGNRPGDLITFRIRLVAPATGNQTVAWGLSPPHCFEQASPGTSYSPTWNLNTPNSFVFTSGQQQRDLTVRIANNSACIGANRLIQTWHPTNTSVMTAPTYQSRTFTINQPQ